MEKETKRRKFGLIWIIRIGVTLGIALFVLIGLQSCTSIDLHMPDFSQVFNPDPVMGYRHYEIVEMVAGKNKETQELKVLEQEIETTAVYDNTFLNIDWFRKSQTVHMFGTASYTVDLSKISEEDIIIDEENKTVTVVIPHAQLDMLEMNYDKTTFDEIDREILGWGDVNFTPEQQNQIQKEMTDTIKEMATQEEFLKKADESAVKQVKDLYKGLLVELKEDVTINVVFEINSNEN